MLAVVLFTSLSDSTRTWSYSLSATRNMMDVTFSKQWIHFLLSDLWPPTSTILTGKTVAVSLLVLVKRKDPVSGLTWTQHSAGRMDTRWCPWWGLEPSAHPAGLAGSLGQRSGPVHSGSYTDREERPWCASNIWLSASFTTFLWICCQGKLAGYAELHVYMHLLTI